MAQEEKSKAYNQLVGKIKKAYLYAQTNSTKAVLEDILPELAESKDEKIRKAIRGWIYTRPSQFFDGGFSKEEMLAWLEKQGKQKPADNEMIEILRAEYEKGRADAIAEMQNTAWSEEDEMFVHGLIRGLSAKRDIHGHTTFSSDCIDITETINWLKSLKERVHTQTTWKPRDKQIKAIRLARSFVVDDFGEQPTLSEILMELEEQLQKIKEGQTKNR